MSRSSSTRGVERGWGGPGRRRRGRTPRVRHPQSRMRRRPSRRVAVAGVSPLALRSAVVGLALEGPYFDGEGVSSIAEDTGQLTGPGQGGIQIGRLDDEEAADVLLAFGV